MLRQRLLSIRPVSHVLVIAQLSGVAVACFPTSTQGSYAWLLLCVLGALLGIATLYFNRPGNFSVYPEIKRDAALIMTGPYRFVRHPMYCALVTMMVGIAIYNGGWLNALGAMLVTAAVVAKANKEEQLLRSRFPQYAHYAASTGRFFPRLRGSN
ncbi:MAG: isoprenylcysteine carboxylmethyltransferase family protein [Gammaproteobacteria bacterium]|nr:isoprenylcysteine carboxylmethyltransferase family protein [Gammaproteobacteria bacterium]